MYKYVKDESNFYDLALELAEGNIKQVYCDLETTGLDARLDKILLFQIMTDDEIYIFDFLKLNNEHLKYIVDLLENTAKVTSVWHNAKFDIKFLAHNTGMWLQRAFDTMNAEVLLNAGLGKSTYSLKELALKYAGVELNKDDREVFYKTEVKVITEQMLQYAGMDVKVLPDIYFKQLERAKEAKEIKVLDLEMGLLSVIAKMEYDGVLLDQEQWLVLDDKERIRYTDVKQKLIDSFVDGIDVSKYADAFELAKAFSYPMSNLSKKKENIMKQLTGAEVLDGWFRENFNLGSTYQVQAALGLTGVNVTTTDKKVLEKLERTPVISNLLELSESEKRISTYGRNVIAFIHPVTGRIHVEFLDMGAATGRLSSGNPMNLQNIPTATGYRESFISAPDYDWISADYSQQEFRLAGAVSGEQVIIDAYLAGQDMHTATSSVIYNKALKDITKQERFVGKTANFTIVYGGTEWALGKNLGLGKEKSLEILNLFHKGYPIFSEFKSQAEKAILKMGFSSSVLGRRRYNEHKPIYQTNKEYVKYINKQRREGFNHIIQSTAADITKIAMLNISRNNPFGEMLRMLIQVHDELNFEAHKSIAKDAAEFIKYEMLKAEQPFLGPIPAAVDVSISNHWVH